MDTGSTDTGIQPYTNDLTGKVSAFGAGNPALSTGTKEATKRKKPKQALSKTTSTFISRFQPSESLSKRLQERSLDGLFAFVNVKRAFEWIDLTSTGAVKVSTYLETGTMFFNA